MRKTHFTIALCSLMAVLPAHAQSSKGYDFTQDDTPTVGYDFTQDDTPAGYDFTQDEEDPAEAEKKKKNIQTLIYNGQQYAAACRKAYLEEVVWPVSACCDGIIGNEDLVECTKDPVPADLHREAISKIVANHPFATDSGEFTDGLFCRATLAKAKPNMNSKQYAEIEHMITRAEMLMKWFTGAFAKACAAHNYDFLKEVQRVARFKVYLKTAKIEEIDKMYYSMIRAYTSSYVTARVDKVYREVAESTKVWSEAFFQHFHNEVSQAERDQWLCFVVMGGNSHSTYNGPRFGVDPRFYYEGLDNPYVYYDIRGGKVVPAATSQATELASYTRYFEFWTQSRILSTMEMGDKANSYVKRAANDYFSGIAKVAGDIVVKEDADFKRTVAEKALYALDKLNSMDDELVNFNDYLQNNSNFLKNRSRTTGNGALRQMIQEKTNHANLIFAQIQEKARRTIPASAPSRATN